MIHRAWAETDKTVGVTAIALRTGRNVGHRLGEGVEGNIATAVAGRTLAGRSGMIHGCRLERQIVAVTGTALAGRWHMRTRFTKGRRTVVAGRTTADSTGAMNISCPCPAHVTSRVAGIALGCGWHVCRRFGRGLGKDERAVVAGSTVTHCDRRRSIGVIHGRRRKGGGIGVANIAVGTAWNMGGRLAQTLTCSTVVARGATAMCPNHHTSVIECAGRPGRVVFGNAAGMAGITLSGSRDMGRRFDLSVDRQIRAAVTGRAVSGNKRTGRRRMVHRCRSKGRKVGVTGIAGSCRRQMATCLARRIGAVVAGGTGASANANAAVAEGSWLPHRSAMTAITGLRGWNMSDRFGLGILRHVATAVAGRAIARRHRTCCRGVVHGRWRPDRVATDVTGIALAGSRDVTGWLGQGINSGKTSAMATAAVPRRDRSGHAGMIGGRRCERGEVGVADVTGGRRRNMAGRLAQALPGRTVVTGGAAGMGTNHNTGMAEGTGCPCRKAFRDAAGVAAITLGRGCNVCCRFALGINRHQTAIVTA